MGKTIKFKNDTYIDAISVGYKTGSSGIQDLKTMLERGALTYKFGTFPAFTEIENMPKDTFGIYTILNDVNGPSNNQNNDWYTVLTIPGQQGSNYSFQLACSYWDLDRNPYKYLYIKHGRNNDWYKIPIFPRNYNSEDCYIHLYWPSDRGYNAGGNLVEGLTTAFAKHATFSGNTITIPVDGLYSIECHYHMLDRTYRTFMTLSFRNAGSLGPDNYRTGDDQGIGTHATDPLVATHFTAYLAAGTTISLEIYFAANTALQGGIWNSFIDIKKIGPYPNV